MDLKLYDLSVLDARGTSHPLSQYRDWVMLIVNVASRCGFTPQYKGLEELYLRLRDQKFIVLGFPCNQFGTQEPGSNEEIQQFCQLNYGVSFPVLQKIEVNGPNTHELFKLLKDQAPGLLGSKAIKWNFTKFLVDRSGKVLKRYAPQTDPLSILPDLEKAIAENS